MTGLKFKCRSTDARSLPHSKLFHGASNSRKNEVLSAKNGILWENTVSYRTTKFSLPLKVMGLYFPLTFTKSLSCLWLQKTEHLFVVVKEFIILGVCYILYYNKSWHCFVFWEEGHIDSKLFPTGSPLKCLQWPGLGQEWNPSQKCEPGLPCGKLEPKYLSLQTPRVCTDRTLESGTKARW